ncbi:hypothetical protein BJY52DRAFT_1227059 [Lactarius psammicola]|nr:hypothetical protein BJY52DRAFT_1227059 [Lactarius psammicola]
MLLVSASLSLPLPLPPPSPTPLTPLFTQGHNYHRPYPPKKHPPTQHNILRALGPLSTTKKYMRLACGGLLPLLLVLLAQTSVGGSVGAGTVSHSGQRDDAFNILSGALCPLHCLDGSSSGSDGCDSQQNGTPERYLYPLSTMIAAPAPALTVGLLTLLWVWVLDGAVLPLRVRALARGRAAAARKGACRCRVCTLRMQARGRPLHDAGARGASAKALKSWS